MKRHEIINKALNHESISFEDIHPYRKTIAAYFRDYYCSDPIFLVTMVSNNSCFGQIVSYDDFNEALYHILEEEDLSEEDRMSEEETISDNSFFL